MVTVRTRKWLRRAEVVRGDFLTEHWSCVSLLAHLAKAVDNVN